MNITIVLRSTTELRPGDVLKYSMGGNDEVVAVEELDEPIPLAHSQQQFTHRIITVPVDPHPLATSPRWHYASADTRHRVIITNEEA